LDTRAILALVVGAFVLRVAWMLWHGPGEITWDGAEYARLAQNLLGGLGYVGMRGHELYVFPPLYSLAIAVLLPFTHDAELAGTLVSLIAGALLVVPVWMLATDLYGPRAGLPAGVLAATLPFTVQLSTVVLAESLFLTLVATGLAFAVRAARDGRVSDAVGCGGAFGLAYHTRPEAALFAAVAAVAVVAGAALRREPVRRGVLQTAALVLPCALLAAPYVAFLSTHAGHFRWEGKSELNLDIGLRMSRGTDYAVAADSIDRRLRQLGPELADDYYFEPPGRRAPSIDVVLAFGAHNTIRHVPEALAVMWSRLIGGPLLVALALVGLIAGPWTRRRAGGEAVVLAYVAASIVALASVYHFWERYFIDFVLPLVLWGAHGITVVERYVPRRLPTAIAGIALVAATFSLRAGFSDDATSLSERQAGLWIAAHAPPGVRILGISDQGAYYANAIWSMLPVAPDDETALRYVAAVRPAYVMLDREYADERPYVIHWLDRGIPDPRARRIFVSGSPHTPTLSVYAWDPHELSTLP
jgi:4-amino-4-deoxy-L-arabinose transferase-like glycosyltransferase